MTKTEIQANRVYGQADVDTHLRSTRETLGYQVQATDASFGKVEDFLIDDTNWAIRYLVVDTGRHWSQRPVLIPAEFVESVNWSSKHFGLSLPQNIIRRAPGYDGTQLIDREFEKRLYGYYERPGYWTIPNEPTETTAKKVG